MEAELPQPAVARSGRASTHFLAIDLKYRGRPGDAVLFFNTDEAGAPDRHTLHAGMPVESGVKWLASKWYRERAYG